MVLYGCVGPHVHQLNDLTVGLSPFTCGFFVGQKGSPVATRVKRYDSAMAGVAAPTIAEQDEFRTKEVPFHLSGEECFVCAFAPWVDLGRG